jgi:uncharacterized tellurite resistance protein B-like protein
MNNSFSGLSAEAIFQQMQSLQKKRAGALNKNELSLATAIVLMEIASSDSHVDKFEQSVIHHGLKSLFGISDETAAGVVAKARAALANMRSSSTEATLLRETLDPTTKRAMAGIMDNLIRCNGVVDGMEIYLRKRFRDLLGLPDEPLSPLSSEE